MGKGDEKSSGLPNSVTFGYGRKLQLDAWPKPEVGPLVVHYPCWDGCPHFRGLSETVVYWDGLRDPDGARRLRPAGLCSPPLPDDLRPYSVRSYVFQLSRLPEVKGCSYLTAQSPALAKAVDICYPFQKLARDREDLCPGFAVDELGLARGCGFATGHGDEPEALRSCSLWGFHKALIPRENAAARRLLAAYLGSITSGDDPMLIPGVWLDGSEEEMADFALVAQPRGRWRRIAVRLASKGRPSRAREAGNGSALRGQGFTATVLDAAEVARAPARHAQELLRLAGLVPSAR